MENKHLISFIYKNDRVLYPFEKYILNTNEKLMFDLIKFKFGFIPILLNKSSPSKYGTLIKIISEEKIEKEKDIYYNFSIIGFKRFKIIKIIEEINQRKALVEFIDDNISIELESTLNKNDRVFKLKEMANIYFSRRESNRINNLTFNNLILNETNLVRLCFIIMSLINCNLEIKVEFLSLNNIIDRINFLIKYFGNELRSKKIEKKSYLVFDLDKKESLLNLKENYLKKNINTSIKNCIIENIDKLIKNLGKNNELENRVEKNYLTYLLKIPWNKNSIENYNIFEAKKLLNKKHFGLKNVKNRIWEYLSVRKVNGKNMPIICLNGPPGVGKTSISKVIAKVLNKKFYRQSLSGVKEENLLIGTSKYYVGSYPGLIIDSLINTQTMNPLILLDEIDKINQNYKRNPSFPLLEILDKNQNKYFKDHYINLPINISNIFFILTSNSLINIHPTLLDRLEIIDIEGYNLKEKVEICKWHLFKKIVKNNGMKTKFYKIDEKIFEKIIESYTHEVGLRELSRCLDKIIRYSITKFIKENQSEEFFFEINEKIIKKLLKPVKAENIINFENKKGIINFLSYNQNKFNLNCVEVDIIKGYGKTKIIGNYEKNVEESVNLAFNWLKINLEENLQNLLDKSEILLHFPNLDSNYIEKSATISIWISILSVLLNKEINYSYVFFGHFTLKGELLKNFNINSKFCLKWENNIKDLFISYENEEIFKKINYKKNLNIHCAKNIKDIIKIVFNKNQGIFKNNEILNPLVKL